MSATQTSNDQVSVLLIDDDVDHLDLLTSCIKQTANGSDHDSFKVHSFNDPAQAIAKLSTLDSTVVVCDYKMPGGTGLDWLQDFHRAGAGPVILITGQGDERIAAEAFREGAADYLTKSSILSDPTLLTRAIHESLRRDRLETCNSQLARQLQQANQALSSQNRKLEDLSETAHRFVENVAHEFRTPLTVIREFASILRDGIGGEINDTQQEYVEYIINATGDLAHLVDDFLDSGRLKSRTLRVDRQRLRPQAILEHTRKTIKSRALNKRIEVVEHITPNLSDLFADLDKAGRTLINLAVNAVKFSPFDQKIIISCSETGNGEVLFAVTDSGPGLPPEEVENIFERFTQVGDVQRSSTRGFGLGLNIARELVWLNLGVMQVESEQGVGSTFGFTLPVYDPAVIVEHFLQNIAAVQPDTRVTVLECRSRRGDADIETLRSWLAGTCYPTDVALPVMNGDAVILFGLSDEPDTWISRLNEINARERHNAESDDGLDVQIAWLGSWRHPDEREAINANTIGRAMGVRAAG